MFNQAVFVCDWWMNVDCQSSQQFFNNNNEQFENLRLGPQLMKDIKKMLTHPMLNPYDKTAMKSNLIVMQDYKPPFGQLFPNGALLAGPERAPNNVYVPAKQIQQNFIQGNSNDFTYSASTPDPRYLPAPLNANFLPFQRDAEVFQRQRQNGQHNAGNSIQNARVQTTQISQTGKLISNGHAGRFQQNGNTNLPNNNGYSQAQVQAPRPTQITNNFSQRHSNSVSNPQSDNAQKTQRAQANKQRAQYTEPRRLPQTNNEVQFAKLQNSQNNIQDKQPYTYSTPATNTPQYSNNLNNPAGKELKENLVSTIRDIPSTVITKTLTYSRLIQEPQVGKPKSRITVKTWIIKPTKSAKLIAEPTPYTYARPSAPSPPSPSPTERLIEENSPYVYDVPTTSQTEKIISGELESEQESEEPYVYNRPTPSAKQVQTTEIQTTRIFLAPTTLPTRASFSGRITNFPQSSPPPTKASRLYLTPSPFTSTARFYLPPPRNPTTLPRLYLPQNIQQPVYYQNAQLRASPTIPTPTRVTFSENLNQPSFSGTKQSRVNTNHQNLTFTDILTKEKLDITVNDIVKDTDDILKTASPPQYSQYQNHKEFKSLDYPENYLSSRTTTDSGETLTSQVPIQTPTASTKSSRIVSTPATSLQPPNENFIYQNINQLANLPFFKESGIPNTIERTVSIKITIPERIAAFLFKNRSDSEFDKLEILNTGSSNYLVMSNNFIPKKNAFNFIPIAKLIGNQNSNNISDSQALVYSFLTDSINVAREYNNIAQRDIQSSTASPALAQFQNLNNEKLSQITNQISQLTSSQYSSNNLNRFDTNANIISAQRTNTNLLNQFTGSPKYTDGSNQAQQTQTKQLTPSQQIQGNFYSSRFQVPNTQQSLLNSQNQLYSGQLYQWSVPDVTNQVYNRPSPANLVNPSNIQLQTTKMFSVQRNTNQNNVVDNINQPSPHFEVVKAETVALNPAKLQREPPNEGEQFASQEALNRLLNSENGIFANLEDKIVGTIPHPLEDNKVLTYKKDQSYYLYTKLEDNNIEQNSPTNQQTTTNTQQNAKLTQSSNENMPKNLVSFQLIPSVSYELEDEKDQQKFLSAFQIDEFGAPRDIVRPQNGDNQNNNQAQQIMTSSVDYSVEHPMTPKQNEQYRVNPLYSGPSSYTAPQSSVGSLGSRQVLQNNFNSRLEDFDSSNNNGYPKERPARQFIPTYRYN